MTKTARVGQQSDSGPSAEREYLGSVLRDNRLAYSTGALAPEYFTTSLHRAICAQITQFLTAGEDANVYSVGVALQEAGILKEGDWSVLCDLTVGPVCKEATVQQAARHIREAARHKQFQSLIDRAAAQQCDSTLALDQAIVELTRGLINLNEASGDPAGRSGAEAMESTLSNLALRHSAGNDILGLTTGLNRLDRATGGLRPGEYTIVAAWTGGGKSAFALGVTLANLEAGVPVAYFSLEMQAEELMERALAALSGIDYQLLHHEPSRLSQAELETLNAVGKRMASTMHNLHLDEKSRTINELLMAAQRMIVRYRVGLIVVDHLHLVHAEERDPRLRVNVVSGALRELAKDSRSSILALSQLSRLKEPNEVPTIYHLKESGDLEQDAHRVLLLHRPLENGHYTGEDTLILGKQRSGPTGHEPVRFNSRLLTWEER